MTRQGPVAAPRHAIGIGASAGGVLALIRLVRELPPDLAAPVLVVLHITPSGPILLPSILDRETPLTVESARDGAALVPGRIVVAPPDRHLLVADGRVVLDAGPKVNGTRPSVDPLLCSLAREYGPGAVAVVLSGALGDGAAGAWTVAQAGGAVLVQDPDDADVPSMPQRALAEVGPAARVLRAPEMSAVLAALVGGVPEEDHVRMDGPDQTRSA